MPQFWPTSPDRGVPGRNTWVFSPSNVGVKADGKLETLPRTWHVDAAHTDERAFSCEPKTGPLAIRYLRSTTEASFGTGVRHIRTRKHESAGPMKAVAGENGRTCTCVRLMSSSHACQRPLTKWFQKLA
jgi:hypothetical protein